MQIQVAWLFPKAIWCCGNRIENQFLDTRLNFLTVTPMNRMDLHLGKVSEELLESPRSNLATHLICGHKENNPQEITTPLELNDNLSVKILRKSPDIY